MGIQIRNICFEDLLMSALLGEKKKIKRKSIRKIWYSLKNLRAIFESVLSKS